MVLDISLSMFWVEESLLGSLTKLLELTVMLNATFTFLGMSFLEEPDYDSEDIGIGDSY